MRIPLDRPLLAAALIFVVSLIVGRWLLGRFDESPEPSKSQSQPTRAVQTSEQPSNQIERQAIARVTESDAARQAAIAVEQSCKPVLERYRVWLRQQSRQDLTPEEHTEIQRCSHIELTPPESRIRVTAYRLAMDFNSGGLTPAPYWGHWVEVSDGVVDGVVPIRQENKTSSCSMDVLLNGSLHACIVGSQQEESRRLEIGQSVNVICIAEGIGSGQVFMSNCHLN